MPTKWYTAAAAAPFLKVTPATVKDYIRKGVIKGKQVGRRKVWHIKGSEIVRLRRDFELDIL